MNDPRLNTLSHGSEAIKPLSLSVKKAKKLKFPLYWAYAITDDGEKTSWLEVELWRLGNLRAVAREYGYNEHTLRDFMRRHGLKNAHGSMARGSSNWLKQGEAFRLEEQGLSKAEIAQRLNVSTVTVWRWLKD